MVALAREAVGDTFLLHLSTLAKHTRNLLERPDVSLAMGELDDGRADPQTLSRITLKGRATVLEGDDRAGDCYLSRFPEAGPRFGFADFKLFRLAVTDGRFVGGFARASKVTPGDLRRITMPAD